MTATVLVALAEMVAAEIVWERLELLYWTESQRPQQQLMSRSTEANIEGRNKQSSIRQQRPVAEPFAGQHKKAPQSLILVVQEVDEYLINNQYLINN
uniref:Uncharacterized protein n=1 Tax=Sphaerodactylus townsendi TaxID=933632 RepID=A0ACB8G4S5_9SAUR